MIVGIFDLPPTYEAFTLFTNRTEFLVPDLDYRPVFGVHCHRRGYTNGLCGRVKYCCLRIDKPFAGLNTPRKQPVVVVDGLAKAAPTRLGLATVAVRVVEVACLVEATHAYAGVHLVLAENARVVEVAEFVMFSKVLLIGTARQRT